MATHTAPRNGCNLFVTLAAKAPSPKKYSLLWSAHWEEMRQDGGACAYLSSLFWPRSARLIGLFWGFRPMDVQAPLATVMVEEWRSVVVRHDREVAVFEAVPSYQHVIDKLT